VVFESQSVGERSYGSTAQHLLQAQIKFELKTFRVIPLYFNKYFAIFQPMVLDFYNF